MATQLHDVLLDDLTPTQREAVQLQGAPLLILAGAGTGKTTVITRRMAWLLLSNLVRADEVLALTFTDKAAAEMEERVDLLVPYGYVDVTIKTFHAFCDQLLREHALRLGFSPQFRVFSKAEQLVFLRQHVFELPLSTLRPLQEPTRFVEALATVFARAKDEAVSPEEWLRLATADDQQALEGSDEALRLQARRTLEVANAYVVYQRLLREADAMDFGDLILLAIELLERHPDVRAALTQRFRALLVDEFQDTNYAQFRLLQWLVGPTSALTVVADDDQSIYQWRGAAISNVMKLLEAYPTVRTVVLAENFRSTQPILDCAYRLIRFNDPDRLEVRAEVNKRLVAMRSVAQPQEPHLKVFETASDEADWVARTIRAGIESKQYHPRDVAILVRSNREADLFLRALNVAGIPWQFSGGSHLFYREESKLLLSCLRTLADPEDSMSWYHVASSLLYACPMVDLMKVLSIAATRHESVRQILARLQTEAVVAEQLSPEGKSLLTQLCDDVQRLLGLSRTYSSGQLLYRWLSDRSVLATLAQAERTEDAVRVQTIANFFDQLRRVEAIGGGRLPEVMKHLDLFLAVGNDSRDDEDAFADRVHVLTIHKAKGLEFPVVFLVGLVQGRFPTPRRRDSIELPERLIKDLLPSGDYHLQEERRLFYVAMTRAKEILYLTCAYDYGGKTVRKISQFVVEALGLPSPKPLAQLLSARERVEQDAVAAPLPVSLLPPSTAPLRLDPHGIDDYVTCPLKYRYSHLVRVPVMRHHLVIYGNALHKAVELFFKRQLQGALMSEEELLTVFEHSWSAEGFLTKAHEALRLEQGKATLRRFYAQQHAAAEHPMLIEEKFTCVIDDLLVVGRWDRVDQSPEGAVIIDYKSSDVRDQAAANRRAQESIQLLVYTLAWFTLHQELPVRVELRFLETGVIGSAALTEEDLEQGKTMLREVARGIRAGEFRATPQEHTCRWCAFQTICPSAFQTA